MLQEGSSTRCRCCGPEGIFKIQALKSWAKGMLLRDGAALGSANAQQAWCLAGLQWHAATPDMVLSLQGSYSHVSSPSCANHSIPLPGVASLGVLLVGLEGPKGGHFGAAQSGLTGPLAGYAFLRAVLHLMQFPALQR